MGCRTKRTTMLVLGDAHAADPANRTLEPDGLVLDAHEPP